MEHKSIWGYSQERKMQLTNQALILLPVEVESLLLIVMPILYISQTNKTKEESFQMEGVRWVEPKESFKLMVALMDMEHNKITVLL